MLFDVATAEEIRMHLAGLASLGILGILLSEICCLGIEFL